MSQTSWRDKPLENAVSSYTAQNLGAGHPVLTLLCAILFGAADAFGIALQTSRMPPQLASLAPYITTLVGLVIIGQARRNQEKKRALALGAKELEVEKQTANKGE